MQDYSSAKGSPTREKSSGADRLQDELNEINKRIGEATHSVSVFADKLYGPRPSDAGEGISPSANTIDSRLGDARRALNLLDGEIRRLHES